MYYGSKISADGRIQMNSGKNQFRIQFRLSRWTGVPHDTVVVPTMPDFNVGFGNRNNTIGTNAYDI